MIKPPRWRALARASLILLAAMLFAPQASLAQESAQRVGAVNFNEVLAVARSVTPTAQLQRNIVQSLTASFDVQQTRLDAERDRLQRQLATLDEATVQKRTAALQSSYDRIASRQAQVQSLVDAANAGLAGKDPAVATYLLAKAAIGAAATLEDIDLVVDTPLYSRSALDLTARVAGMLRGQ